MRNTFDLFGTIKPSQRTTIVEELNKVQIFKNEIDVKYLYNNSTYLIGLRNTIAHSNSIQIFINFKHEDERDEFEKIKIKKLIENINY